MLVGRLAPLPVEGAREEAPPELLTLRLAEPHRQLMVAVLQTVVDDYLGGSDRRRRDARSAIDTRAIRKADAYVTSIDRAWPFSFENLCEALDLDAAEFRTKLAEFQQRGRRGEPCPELLAIARPRAARPAGRG